MKPLVDYLARALVDDPAPVEVEEVLEGEDAIYKLKVGQDDLGKVIGKKGRTAKALRTLLAAAGAKQNLRVSLEIVEPEDGRRPRRNDKRGDRGPETSGDGAPVDGKSDADPASTTAASAAETPQDA